MAKNVKMGGLEKAVLKDKKEKSSMAWSVGKVILKGAAVVLGIYILKEGAIFLKSYLENEAPASMLNRTGFFSAEYNPKDYRKIDSEKSYYNDYILGP